MIAIVILGLGLIMVATMFPVAWTRARTLTEISTEQSIVADAEGVFKALIRPATVAEWLQTAPSVARQDRLVAGGLLGDLFYDANMCQFPPCLNPIVWYSDTRVHVLHASNALLVANPPIDPDGNGIVNENPWASELVDDWWGSSYQNELEQTLGLRSPFDPQIELWQRVYPPLDAPPLGNPAALAQWQDRLSQRRFAWAVLYRLRDQIGPSPLVLPNPTPQEIAAHLAAAAAAMGLSRELDVYFVTLRRPNPTNRYAQQDTSTTNAVPPLPDLVLDPPSRPAARPPADDVSFPVAWRVEVEFPNQPYASRMDTANRPTGVATEVRVPRVGPPALPRANATMLVGMFPEGTRFVDEISGQVYRAVKRRVANDGQSSTLTLDREIFIEDLDYSNPNGFTPDGTIDAWEFIRTVWVFPPPVDRENSDPNTSTPVFSGVTPVINIEVRSISLAPTS